MAYITPPTTQLGTKPSPFMAAFSSIGPSTITPEILKVLTATQLSENTVFIMLYYKFCVLYTEVVISA